VKRFAVISLFALANAVVAVGAKNVEIPAPDVEKGYLKLSFYWLSCYDFVRPDIDAPNGPDGKRATGEEQIPPAIKKWNGAKAMVSGFMLPTVLRDGKATEILLMANLMLCCYGTVPKVNDWIIVRVPDGTDIIQDRLMTFRGTFHVGAQIDNGVLSAVYEMDADGPGKIED
jgi:hypothetical protein